MLQPRRSILPLATRAPHRLTARPALNRAALVETGLLAAQGLLLLTDVARGVLAFYNNPRFNGLVLVGALALLTLAVARVPTIFTRPGGPLSPRTASYVLLSLPLLPGVLYPPFGRMPPVLSAVDCRERPARNWGSQCSIGHGRPHAPGSA